VTFNARDYALRCLASVVADAPCAELIVIDNASADGTAGAIRVAFPAARLIENDTNRGFTVASNQGIAAATGATILLLNPDSEVRAGALDRLCGAIEERGGRALAGPRIVDEVGRTQASAWRFPTAADAWLAAFGLQSLRPLAVPLRRLRAGAMPGSLSGAALAFGRPALEELGPLDEQFFWSEDADYGRRAAEHGIPRLFVSRAVVLHHVGKSSGGFHGVRLANQILSRLKYLARHDGPTAHQLALAAAWTHIALRLAASAPLAVIKPTWRPRLRTYAFAASRLLRYTLGDRSIVLPPPPERPRQPLSRAG
jgi:GT2 family glycosyltransferase